MTGEAEGFGLDDVLKYGGAALAGAGLTLLIEHRDKIADLIRRKKDEGANDEEIKEALKEVLREVQSEGEGEGESGGEEGSGGGTG